VTSNGDGSGLWKITEPCGNTYNFMGLADLNNGGGDTDVELGTVRNANGFYNRVQLRAAQHRRAGQHQLERLI
jgi:hypothetical protein